jgi:hypothetical protein
MASIPVQEMTNPPTVSQELAFSASPSVAPRQAQVQDERHDEHIKRGEFDVLRNLERRGELLIAVRILGCPVPMACR